MLLVQDLNLNRSGRKIFKNVSFSLPASKMVILKGKNGSGKTSLLKTILNLLEPSSGSIYWKGKLLNKNLNDFYKSLTYISDKTTSVKQLSVFENIKIWKKIFLSSINSEEIIDILSMLKLKNYLNTKVNSLSLGEVKKLELLRLIIENKKVWMLDEPFTNLDYESVNMIEQTFLDHCSNGGYIIFSSHYEPELEIYQEVVL